MPLLLLLAGVILLWSDPGSASEQAELMFLGQTQFVFNESSDAVVRLVVKREGDPVNVTVLVLVRFFRNVLLIINGKNTRATASCAVFLWACIMAAGMVSDRRLLLTNKLKSLPQNAKLS